MNGIEVLDLLRTHKPEIERRFGVADLALFGSFARDQATDASDIDIVVLFETPPNSRRYFGARTYLENVLGRPVDLVTDNDLRSEIRPYVERDIAGDTGHRKREWLFYIRDMLEFCEKILSCTEGLEPEAFIADGLTYDATLRNIQLIGDSAMRIPRESREAHPQIEWSDIIGTRNRVAHGYTGINNDVIWDIIRNDIPALALDLRKILDDDAQGQ